ncbi:hypothetical protein COL08_22935 [Priestia megaterium]|uniref:MspI family type II restriction endonuclease n=1 Tax=Priestia megaterium TaxID=1404 RepID=UPI000BF91114|nr:MspI family type II restriction endonuclease [Priestia megaterium]PFV93052.1 hypothetical protein COL08_22935 [Priestia megaterium]
MSNLEKSLHGKNAQEKILTILNLFKSKGYIVDFSQKYKIGYPEKKKDQFFFQYLMTLQNGEEWIVQSTTSIRSDRINIQQWNAYHIKKINSKITRAIIVCPDGLSEKEMNYYLSYKKQIDNGILYSAIDDVINISDFYNLIEEMGLHSKSLGARKALEGNNFENRIVEILNDNSNLTKWNYNSSIEVGFQYEFFNQILKFFKLSSDDYIVSIEATNEIPSLPTRGKPKTDIKVEITLEGSSTPLIYTISCKRTSSKWVSIHEYPVTSFIQVLNIDDEKLKEALCALQDAGGVQSLQKHYKDELESKLPYYNEALAKWAYGGVGGSGNPAIHWADYMFVYKNETQQLEMWDLNSYLVEILKIGGQLNTPFKWTYPSKGKGKRIQLKGKIL